MKNKKSKIIIPAMGLILLSTAASISGSVAWFSANRTVTAGGMKVKAVAEEGILISDTDKTAWTDTANAKVTSADLFPTSTAGTTTPTWAHNNSANADDAGANASAGSYQDLTLAWSASTYGVGYIDSDESGAFNSGDSAYVLLNEFYIKSSGNAITLGAEETFKDLYIQQVQATSAASWLKIDNSLRVLVVVGSSSYIYAPVKDQASGTTTLSYKFKNTTDVTALDATVAAGQNKTTSTTSLGNTDVSALKAQVYVYFEGEDANCKSTNISGIDTNYLTVTVKFGLTTI